MAGKPMIQVTFRISPELHAQIEETAKRLGSTKTRLFIDALKMLLGESKTRQAT